MGFFDKFKKKEIKFDSKLKEEFYTKLSKAINEDSFEYMYLDKGIMLNIMGKPKKNESQQDYTKRLQSWQNKLIDEFQSKNPDKNMFGFQYSKDFPKYKEMVDNSYMQWLPKEIVKNLDGIGIVAFINLKTFFDNIKNISKEFEFKVENSFEEFLKSLELKLQYSKYKDTNITLPCIKGLAVMCFEIDSMNYYKLILQSAKDNIEINKTGKSLYGSKLISK